MWNILTRSLALCALIFLLASPALSAEPTEKRIALVVGNAAYQVGPLQTAANDAGLIAQTLQAAAFDVIGARDLDQEGLRRAFRDFLDKASASGPDTVAVIYLSGYALQLEGENYFLPIDAKIARDTDVIAEGVRLSDYLRPLAGLQLKASVVVVDGARKLPFAISGQPLASGLALVEPPAGTLVAFNATPGTVAPEQNGPYGIYAQALAEMMRDAGLPIGEVFDRVRLRVSDVAKGAQLPWSASKLATSFVFFERAPDAPAVVSEQNAPARTRGIAELSPPDAYASAVERDNLNGYEQFLSVYGGDPLAERVRAIVAVRREAVTWQSTCLIDTPEAYWSYLRRYPHGPHTGDARRRLALLAVALEPPPSFALVDYDVPPPPPEEFAYIERPIIVFADFGFVPPPPVPDYFLPPPPPDFAVLEAPIVVPEPYVLPVPVFVPLPTWCNVPRYAVHARENVFAEHAHDTFIADRSARSFTIRGHAGEVGAIAPMVTHGASLAASLPASIRARAQDPSRAAGGATHSMTPSARQPLPGMAGHPLPALPGRLGRPLAPSAGSAMAAVPPAGRSGHPQTLSRGIPQVPSRPPTTALPHSLPGTNGHALPQVPPAHRAMPPAQTNILPPQAPRASNPMLAHRPPPAAPLVRPPSPPPAVHAPARPPSAALTPSRPPVQSGPPPQPQVHPAPPPPRPAPPPAAAPRPQVHLAPPPPRPAPPPAAAPRPQIHAAPPPARPAPPPAAAVRPAAPPAARPAQPHKRG
jgi:uncharacterized caspase-like protein